MCIRDSPRYTLVYQISCGSVYSVALCWRKTPIFVVFWTSAFSVVTSCQQSEKLQHGCTITNLPLSNGIKIVSVLQRLHGEIGRTISDVQKRDEQTDRQTDKQTKTPLLHAKFHPHRCSVSSLRGEKPHNRPLSNLNTGALRCAQCCW